MAKKLDEEFRTTGRLRGPLHGVPISVKDHVDVQGFGILYPLSFLLLIIV
jgi:Asp-tRNA(Asn)/Glu-tRNA(Gln) amidotransferase A subunit family amidase